MPREAYVWREGWSDWRIAGDAGGELPAPLPPPELKGSVPSAAPTAPESGGPVTAAERYAERRRRAQQTRKLMAVLLLIVTLAMGGVLAWVLFGPTGDANPAESDRIDPPAAEAPADEAPADEAPADDPDDGPADEMDDGPDDGLFEEEPDDEMGDIQPPAMNE